MAVVWCQNRLWTITAVSCWFWRVNMHVVGQKACQEP